jgi:hypothetical protein
MKKIFIFTISLLILASCTTTSPDATQPLVIPELIDSRIQNTINIDINH